MGQCLQKPKNADCEDQPRAERGFADGKLQGTQGNGSKAIKQPEEFVAQHILPAVACGPPTDNTDDDAATANCSAVAPDFALETEQACASIASCENSGSLFSSSAGYPHASYELGPPTSDDELSRLQALRALDVLDSVCQGRRARIDEDAQLLLEALMKAFNARTSLLAFFEDSRIIIRNAVGLLSPGDFPYRWSMCAYTLTKQRPQTLMIPDTTKDSRFSDNPFVVGQPGIRFYCGAPLISASGHILGTICFADTTARPDFDAGQCRMLNNVAELMVRQLERYGPRAGPAGQNDPETMAVARVARTIDCYEAVTGLVDISTADGWMLMYCNDSWEHLYRPQPRKQLVGRPLQLTMEIEDEPEQGAGAGAKTTRPTQIRSDATAAGDDAVGTLGEEGMQAMPAAARREWQQRRERGPSSQERWERYAASLREGEAVEVRRVRLLMEDGRPSTTVMSMTVRPANSHVLDAAVRMPIGVPPQTALPASILAASNGDKPPLGSCAEVDAHMEDGGAAMPPANPESALDTQPPQPEPHYCFITLVPVREEPGAGSSDDEGDVLQPLPTLPARTPSKTSLNPYRAGGSTAALPSTLVYKSPSGAGSPPLSARNSRCGAGAVGAAAGECEGANSQPGTYARRLLQSNGGALPNGGSVASVASEAHSQRLQPVRGSAAPSRNLNDLQAGAGWTYGMEPIPGMRLGQLLGKGGYGRVFAASYKGKRVAAKVVHNSMLKTANCVNGVTLEALLAQELEHPFIVQTYKCVVRFFDAAERAAMPVLPSYRPSTAGLSQMGSFMPPATPSAVSVIPAMSSDGSKVSQALPKMPSATPAAAAKPAAGIAAGSGQAADFDSFDAAGAEDSNNEGGGMIGMIDQLGGGGGPMNSLNTALVGTATIPSATNNFGAGSLRPSMDMPSAAALPSGAFSASQLMTPGADGGASAVFGRAAAVAAAAAAASANGTASLQQGRGEPLAEGETWILQEYCTYGTLQDAIDTGKLRTEPSRLRGEPHMPTIILTAMEVASAISCLHGRGYMHGDLSAVNVLLTEPPIGEQGSSRSWVAKVSDFGLAKALPDPTKPYVSSVYGVITHCAPEVLKFHTQSQKADSYSFGVLLWQMYTGSRPWANMNRFQILGAVTSPTSPGLRFLPTQQPPSRYRKLTMRCLSYDPAARPTFAEICEELRLMSLEAASAALGRPPPLEVSQPVPAVA